MPPELLTFLTAMTPIGELRASVPLGIVQFELTWPVVFLLSILGNMTPIPPILYMLRTVGGRIERMDNPLGALLRWRTARIERQWGSTVKRYGLLGIVIVVAIPLPFTGAWTGALTVWALRVQPRLGLIGIAIGIVIAGIIVTALTLAGVELIKLFG